MCLILILLRKEKRVPRGFHEINVFKHTTSPFLKITAPIASVDKMKLIFDQMSNALDATFDEGHAKFFTLVKRGGKMVIGDSIVTDAVIHYPQSKYSML